jgi:flagellar hook-associated protein 1 FlgK
MPGLFAGLEIGKRALMSHQIYLQTIGHNIANVNTPGYTRQRVRISATMPEQSINGPIGSGVQVDNIRHLRDLFLGSQYRDAQKQLGQWEYKQKNLGQIESLFNEPGDNSLNKSLNNFWDSWSTLSTNSDSISHREIVVAEAQQLVNGFRQMARSLMNQRESVNRDLTNITNDVNRITTEVASLNRQIQKVELDGTQAADLRDKRDLLTDELSNIIDARTKDNANGTTTVYMGAMVLVDGADSLEIGVETVNVKGQSTSSIVWKGTTQNLTNLNGQLFGLLETRDEIIPQYLDKLDQLAREVVERVNSIHTTGFGLNGSTGVAFFDPNLTDASSIRINPEILADSARVVASSTDQNDNIAALALAELRSTPVMNDNTVTINDFYDSLVGTLGIESHEADSLAQNYSLLVQQVDNARQSVQGVSLDEEMTNMIQFQHAYDAAARVITTMDQALETIISRMGIVGR